MNEKYAIWKRLHETQGSLMYSLACFGDHLAKREGYKALDGIEALQFYLVEKYKWLPSQVKSLNYDDLQFLFAEEKRGWTLPKEARE